MLKWVTECCRGRALPSVKGGRNLARGSKSLVNERFDIQFDTLNQNKSSELFNGCSKIIIIRIHKRISLFLFFFLDLPLLVNQYTFKLYKMNLQKGLKIIFKKTKQ